MFCKSIGTLFVLYTINNSCYSIDNYTSYIFSIPIENTDLHEILDNVNHIFDILFQQNYLNLENTLQMNISFQELFNKIKNENNFDLRNKLFQEFCQYIFGNEYDNLREIFSIASNEQLLDIKNILELKSYSQYMKEEYMNVKEGMTTIINTFVEQCQEGLYGNCNIENDFNKLFETFFKETKEKQYVNKIKKYNTVICKIQQKLQDEIQQGLQNNITLKQQIILLLNNRFNLVNQHVNDIFRKVNDTKLLCYLKVTKGDMYTNPITLE